MAALGELVRAVLRRAPENVDALHLLGATWARSGVHLGEAAKTLERAFGLRPASGEIAGSLGGLYLQLGRLDEAQRLLERAERQTPDDPAVLARLGDLYLRRADRSRALDAYRRALARRPEERTRHAVEEQLLLLETGRIGAR